MTEDKIPQWKHINEGIPPNEGLFRYHDDPPVWARWIKKDNYGASVYPIGRCEHCGGSIEEHYVTHYLVNYEEIK